MKLNLIQVQLGDGTNKFFWKEGRDQEDLRIEERKAVLAYYNPDNTDNLEWSAMAYVDQTKDVTLGAILSIFRTLLVCVVLGGGAMLFSDSAEKLIVAPIEEMLKKIDMIAKNPLEA